MYFHALEQKVNNEHLVLIVLELGKAFLKHLIQGPLVYIFLIYLVALWSSRDLGGVGPHTTHLPPPKQIRMDGQGDIGALEGDVQT